ncbi:MAG: hypothetical protein QXI92_02200 [Candidatus Nitrosocaldus sp.]
MIEEARQIIHTKVDSFLTFLIPFISSILLILSLVSISIYQYPEPDAFYYFKSLPLIYWIGFSLAILNISLLLHKNNNRITHIFAIILFCMYLHGIPNLAYETPRYMDVYAHGSNLPFLIKTGHIRESDSYAFEYPSLFILAAILFNVMDSISPYNFLTYPYNFFRFFPILTLLFIAILIYILASRMIHKHNLAVIASFAFLSTSWASLGHFAPYTLSFILYIILLIVLIYKGIRWKKSWIILSLLLLVIINITNPTNAFMLLLTLLFIILISLLTNHLGIYKNILYTRLYLIVILYFIIFSSWTGSSENIALGNAKRYINDFIRTVEGVHKLQLTPSPNESYYLANVMRIAETVVVSIISILMLFFLLKRNKLINDDVLMLSGLLSLMALITIMIFASSALLARIPIYIMFGFAVLLPYSILNNVILRKIKVIFVVVIAIGAYTIPITFYAWDAFFYLNPSLLYSAKLLNEHFSHSAIIHTISSSRSAIRYYDSFDLENNFQYSRELDQDKDISKISIMLSKARLNATNFVVLSENDNNRIKMQTNNYEWYNNLKIMLDRDRFNRVSDVSTTIIFSS